MTPLEIEKIREVVRSPGPCMTIFLPAYRPGGQMLHTPSMLLRNFVQDAARRLETSHVARREMDDLLQPLRAMEGDPRTDEGCHWARTLLRAPGVFETIFLREPVAAKSLIGERFHILPLLGELNLPAEFYVLKISRKNAALFRAQFSLETLPLPGKLPDNVVEFLNLDKPDHDRENRSAAGPSAGRRIRFGTGTERETEPGYVAYYRALDGALREFKPKGPIILAGVEVETTLYREVSSETNLLAGTIGDIAPDQETIELGYTILRAAAFERVAKSLAQAKERLAPSRFTVNQAIILDAAAEGRVARLFVRSGADEDAVNVAVVETIRHGGEAAAAPAEKMESPMTAALRY